MIKDKSSQLKLKSETSVIESTDRLTADDFCRLYGECKDKLYRYALYRLGNPEDAEDAVSECITAAWQGMDKLRSSERFTAWLFGILKNCCASKISLDIKMREAKGSFANEFAIGSADQADFICSIGPKGSIYVELREALAQLKDDEREIVLLSVVAGLSSREIASKVGLTSGSVRSKLARSLAKMKKFLS